MRNRRQISFVMRRQNSCLQTRYQDHESLERNINLTRSASVSLALLVALGISAPAAVLAHSGRLNAEGCHNDNANNSYHCHQSKAPSPYTRSAFGYRSYSTSTDVGFYTKQTCKTNIDHVVSLKDAHQSGASSWSNENKSAFANDRTNHVPSCARVNSSKGASTPSDFLRKSRDNKGMDYEIVEFCSYVEVYFAVKTRYGLSFSNNNATLFRRCGIDLGNG